MCTAIYQKISEIDPIFKASNKLALKVRDKTSIGDRLLRKQGFVGGSDFAVNYLEAGSGSLSETSKRHAAPQEASATGSAYGVPAHVTNIANRRG